jgi:hypothetical protein
MLQEVNFGQKLDHWKQYTDGDAAIPKTNHLQIASDALGDLAKIKDQFRDQIQQGRVNKLAVSEVCDLVDSIERIVQCIFPYGAKEIPGLSDAVASVRNHVLDIDVKDFHPECVIDQLKKLQPSTIGIELEPMNPRPTMLDLYQ